jgi:sortase A
MIGMRRRRVVQSFAASFAVVLLVGCGDDAVQQAATTSTLAATTTTRTPSTTTTVPATTSTTIAPTTSTTEMPTTTSEALPVPLDAPAPRANEPIVELGTIEMPTIGVNKPMFEGVSLTVLDHGPGHWPGSAMPGHVGNVVVGGHRTSHDKPFRNIDQLATGDEVIFTTSEGRFVYRVTSTEVVTPDAIRIIDQTAAFTATLFACHPVGSTRERIVVHLELSNP